MRQLSTGWTGSIAMVNALVVPTLDQTSQPCNLSFQDELDTPENNVD